MIENTQRDLNIAFVNELAIIFEKLGIDTARGAQGGGHQVELPAVPPRPGRRPLHRRRPVLPHAQGRARSATTREVILAGRRINDGMGAHIARKAVQQMIHAGRNIKGARVNVLGLTFKEDVPGHPQLQGGRHHRASCASSASRRTCTTRWRAPRTRCTSTASAALVGRAAGGRRADPRRGAQALPRDPGAGIL